MVGTHYLVEKYERFSLFNTYILNPNLQDGDGAINPINQFPVLMELTVSSAQE